jgi:putative tryptophan/tyrosine transport system substrate-binding protein
MKRRLLLAIAGGTAAVAPVGSRAQQKAVPKVGVLWHAGSAEEEDVYLPVLTKAFADLGYVDGNTIVLEQRFPAEQPARFRSMADELVASKIDAAVAVTELGARELRRASRTIPIVVVLSPDPVAAGLVESLAHPGGNVTGLSVMSTDLSGKRLSLLKEAVPGLLRVALMIDPNDPNSRRVVSPSQESAKALGLSLRLIEVSSPASLDAALDGAAASDALMVAPGALAFNERRRIGAFITAKKLPTEVAVGEMVQYGALLSYGPDYADYFRRAASYIDKILKGARPADLPIEQPSRFKLTINLKVAKSLGLQLSPTLLVSADEVLE